MIKLKKNRQYLYCNKKTLQYIVKYTCARDVLAIFTYQSINGINEIYVFDVIKCLYTPYTSITPTYTYIPKTIELCPIELEHVFELEELEMPWS